MVAIFPLRERIHVAPFFGWFFRKATCSTDWFRRLELGGRHESRSRPSPAGGRDHVPKGDRQEYAADFLPVDHSSR